MNRLAPRPPQLLTLSAGLLLASIVFAMGGKHGPNPVVQQGRWPAGTATLINSSNRVAGHWVNANDEFFFQGDTAAFNDFLRGYARLKGTPLRVIIHTGEKRGSRLWGSEPEIPYDWRLFVQQWGGTTSCDVTIDVWVDREVELDRMHLFGPIAPLAVPVRRR